MGRITKSASLSLVGLLGLLTATPAVAAVDGVTARYTTTGSLDTTFNGTGQIISSVSGDDYSHDLQRDSNGRFVTCGSFINSSGVKNLLVARFNSNGSTDTSFGYLGVTTASWPNPSGAWACAIDANGNIVVAADDNENGFLLVRFTSSGLLDNSFGIGGYSGVSISGSTQALPYDMKIASDGKIVTAGYVALPNVVNDFVVMRHAANGVLDSTFSGDGIATTNIAHTDMARGLALDSSGRPVLAGLSGADINTGTLTVLRYTTSGGLDTSFDSDGILSISFPNYTYSDATSVVIDSSGRIVVGGGAWTTSHPVMAVARINSNGSLDTTFSGDGKDTASALTDSVVNDIKIGTDNKIVVAGAAVQGGGVVQMALARFQSNGGLDTSFGSNGVVATSYSPFNAQAWSLVLDSNKPVITGFRY